MFQEGINKFKDKSRNESTIYPLIFSQAKLVHECSLPPKISSKQKLVLKVQLAFRYRRILPSYAEFYEALKPITTITGFHLDDLKTGELAKSRRAFMSGLIFAKRYDDFDNSLGDLFRKIARGFMERDAAIQDGGNAEGFAWISALFIPSIN